MTRNQKKSQLADVARRRNQTVAEMLKDWGVENALTDSDQHHTLRARCLKEGIEVPDLTVTKVEKAEPMSVAPVKNALVDLSKENTEVASKKARKSKLTLDEPVASDEHVGVVANLSSQPKDEA